MTQKVMSELFDVNEPAIYKHLVNIYEELIRKSTVSKMEIVQKEGQRNVKERQAFGKDYFDENSGLQMRD